MESSWKTYKLGDLTKWSSGGTPKKSEASYWGGDIPWISASSMDGHLYSDSKLRITNKGLANGSRLAPKNSILLLVRGSILHQKIQVGLATKPVAFNQDVKCLVPDEEILDPWYLLLWFKAKEQELLTLVESTGIGAGKFDTKLLSEYPIDIPPANELKKIREFGKALFDKSTNIVNTNQILEQMAQALFKSWFVDFDPVMDNALAAGNPIPDELAHRVEVRKKAHALPDFHPLPDDIRNLFPSEFEQTGEPTVGIGGWVPKGWDFGSLSALAKFTTERTDGKALSLDTYISTDNMHPNKGGVTKASKLPELGTVPAFKAGDILVSNIRPYFKKIWFANFEGGRSNDVLCFEAVNNKGKEYLFNLLYQDTFFDYMMTTSKGSKMPRGDKKAIMDWAIVVPPVKLQNFFSDFVKDYYRVIPNRNRQNDELSKLRDALLPKLISGELKVNKDVTS